MEEGFGPPKNFGVAPHEQRGVPRRGGVGMIDRVLRTRGIDEETRDLCWLDLGLNGQRVRERTPRRVRVTYALITVNSLRVNITCSIYDVFI